MRRNQLEDLGLDLPHRRHQPLGDLLGGPRQEARIGAQALIELASRALETELAPHLGHPARQPLHLGQTAAVDFLRSQVHTRLHPHHHTIGGGAARILADPDAVGRLRPVAAGELAGELDQRRIDLLRDDALDRALELRRRFRVHALQAAGRDREHALLPRPGIGP